MRRFMGSLAAACLLLPGTVAAQTGAAPDGKGLLALLGVDLNAERTEILTRNLHLSQPEAAAFWPLYREYDQELRPLEDERLAALTDYAVAHGTMGSEMVTTIMEKSMEVEAVRLKLRKEYFKKIAKAVSPEVAGRFLHLESVLQHAADLQVQSRIPLELRGSRGEK